MFKVFIITLYLVVVNSVWQPFQADSDINEVTQFSDTEISKNVIDLALAETVRLILFDKVCADCHRSSLETSIPAALAFYDLDETEWYFNLCEEGIRSFEE